LAGFRRILGDYFLLLSNVRDTKDWNTQLRCVQAYAHLAQMASQDEDRMEWKELFDGVDDWLGSLVQKSTTQSNRDQHVQLMEFQQSLCGFFGKINV
jgi:hypothetical protein